MRPLKIATLFASLLLTASAVAQPPEGGPRPGQPGFGGGPFRTPNPLLEALDKDRNGELSPEEIENAVAAIKTLDKNNDGKLEASELRPNFQGMGPGGFGPTGGGNPQPMVDRMMLMDVNKDGKLTGDEIPPFMRNQLDQLDTNKDGSLDKAELNAGMARMRNRQGGPGGPAERGGEGRRPNRPAAEDDDSKEKPKEEPKADTP